MIGGDAINETQGGSAKRNPPCWLHRATGEWPPVISFSALFVQRLAGLVFGAYAYAPLLPPVQSSFMD
jgi:hypothetical protein